MIVTVAHDHFFIAASLASALTRRPLVLIVHDDWVAGVRRTSYLLKYFSAPLFKLISRRASHVYAVSPQMQSMLKQKFGVEAELQLPATEPWEGISRDESANREGSNHESRQILYAGNATGAMEDSLDLLVEFIKNQQPAHDDERDWELDLFIPRDEGWINRKGWNDPRIRVHGWVTQAELQSAISQSDIVFLPFSFRDEERSATEGSFPSKTSDYLASEKPILILAPAYSTIVRYAREFECAEIVDQPNLKLLGQALQHLRASKQRRLELSSNSRKVFLQNHDIRRQRISFARLVASLAY